jgi:hypothetical protein
MQVKGATLEVLAASICCWNNNQQQTSTAVYTLYLNLYACQVCEEAVGSWQRARPLEDSKTTVSALTSKN